MVASLGDEADDVYFIKLEPRRREVREDAAMDGDMELARTMPSFFFIRLAQWRTNVRRLARMRPPCRGGSWRGVRQDDASVNFIKPAPWRTKAWRLGRMPPPCRGGWRHEFRQDDANVNIINPVPQGS